ncbi:MAG: lipid-A-disaccharide synthase [Candidatus Omnitrophota bacterium]
MEKKILIIAGEASGDMHGAHLVTHIKKLNPKISFFGLGGKDMKNAGVHIEYDITRLAVVGFFEILKNYSKFKDIFNNILHKTKNQKPDAAILIDYPGFNLRLAGELKKMGIPVIYFISPQVWAWGEKRIKFIKKTISLMLVLFKFEEVLYMDKTFHVKFVGHPLLDTVKPQKTKTQFLESVSFKKGLTTIALLPGSREREVSNLLPRMLKAAQMIFQKNANTQFFICRTTSLPKELFKRIIDKEKIDFTYTITDDSTYEALNACDLAIVASGTATLETAILNKPMIIVYKVSLSTWLLAKMFVKIPYIGLVNVVAGKKIVPELIQFNATPKKIFLTATELLHNKKKQEKIHAQLYALKNSLGIPGAYNRTAQEIVHFLADSKKAQPPWR